MYILYVCIYMCIICVCGCVYMQPERQRYPIYDVFVIQDFYIFNDLSIFSYLLKNIFKNLPMINDLSVSFCSCHVLHHIFSQLIWIIDGSIKKFLPSGLFSSDIYITISVFFDQYFHSICSLSLFSHSFYIYALHATLVNIIQSFLIQSRNLHFLSRHGISLNVV